MKSEPTTFESATKIQGTIEPVFDIILAKRYEPKSTSRIVLPGTAKQEFQYHKVIAVGPGSWQHGEFVVPPVKVGDVVLMMGPVMDMGEGREMFRASNVVAIIHDTEEAKAVVQ